MNYIYYSVEQQECSVNGVLGIYDVVNSITHSSKPINDALIIPSGYDENIMGKARIVENDIVTFVQVDIKEQEEEEMSQLDIIEANTTYLVMMADFGME